MAQTRLALTLFGIALLGGVLGAIVTVALLGASAGDAERSRGTVIEVSGDPESLFGVPDVTMWCNAHHRFCIPRFDDPHEARALYLGDTHAYFRQAGCFVDWRPDFDLSSFDLSDEQRAAGAFRGGCSGSTFLPDGTRIFGPSPRNLDEFRVDVVTRTPDGREVTFLEVDTSRLICGEWTADYSPGEEPADECELAPPFD